MFRPKHAATAWHALCPGNTAQAPEVGKTLHEAEHSCSGQEAPSTNVGEPFPVHDCTHTDNQAVT